MPPEDWAMTTVVLKVTLLPAMTVLLDGPGENREHITDQQAGEPAGDRVVGVAYDHTVETRIRALSIRDGKRKICRIRLRHLTAADVIRIAIPLIEKRGHAAGHDSKRGVAGWWTQ